MKNERENETLKPVSEVKLGFFAKFTASFEIV